MRRQIRPSPGHGHALRALLAVGLLVSGGGCTAERLLLPLAVEVSPAASPREAGSSTRAEATVREVAALIRDLGLPVPPDVAVHVYGSRHVFEQGLIRDGNISPVRAAELSTFAVGVGKRRQLLLQEDAMATPRERLRLIAHELTHVAQIELTQTEGRAEQWMAEGMAEWVAFAVLERLGFDTVRSRRAHARLAVRDHPAVVEARLDLQTLGTPRGFTTRHLRQGSLVTYQLAFIMTDHLIARDGFEQVVEYFRAFATTVDRHGNFRRAFGQTLAEFEEEVLARIAAEPVRGAPLR
jgi:hypothetical protein